MSHKGKERVESSHFDEEIEFYGGDPDIATCDAKVPNFLKFIYIFLPLWGIATFYFLWNGNQGWLDQGYWHQLQVAANTTFPIQNQNTLPQNQVIDEDTFPNKDH